jgi:hypothetical protein
LDDPNEDTFTEAQRHILTLLADDIFPRFIQSDRYKKIKAIDGILSKFYMELIMDRFEFKSQ